MLDALTIIGIPIALLVSFLLGSWCGHRLGSWGEGHEDGYRLAVQETYEAQAAYQQEVDRLRRCLREIRDFGRKGPMMGRRCAEKANAALEGSE